MGKPSASITSRQRPSWARSSSGISTRVALYSLDILWRKVSFPLSRATMTWVGSSSFITESSVLASPYTAPTISPVRRTVSGASFMAWKERWMMPCPSMSRRRGFLGALTWRL